MYAVRFVRERDLPEEHSWAMVRTEDGSCYLFIKRCELCTTVLEQAWAAYRRITRRVLGAA